MFAAITFLSDFGSADIFVGVCHGVLTEAAPDVRVIDLTHEVPPGDVEAGAVLLARAVAHLPRSIHLAVVDPGVGTARRGIAVATGRGDVLVGPDNGLLVPAVRALGGLRASRELASPRYRRHPTSATFHGRDVFAPAAGALAAGVDLDELGPPAEDIIELPEPFAVVTDEHLEAAVVLVDRFGNLQLATNWTAATRTLGLTAGATVAVQIGDRSVPARVVRTFGELRTGDLGVYEDSDGQVAIARSGHSAAELLGAARGDRIVVRTDR
ncbi:MAG: SAM hydrolase/SAM-dependent halogenase family protein [Nitriliruptorales bacterium]